MKTPDTNEPLRSGRLLCPHCGAPVQHWYEGSSDWNFKCTSPDNVCGASINFWVKGFPNEEAEAIRRFLARHNKLI